jgi:hypothetical protein
VAGRLIAVRAVAADAVAVVDTDIVVAVELSVAVVDVVIVAVGETELAAVFAKMAHSQEPGYWPAMKMMWKRIISVSTARYPASSSTWYRARRSPRCMHPIHPTQTPLWNRKLNSHTERLHNRNCYRAK